VSGKDEASMDAVAIRVTRLLDDRLKLLRWLRRLKELEDSVRRGLYRKVEQDYTERLEHVVDELREYRGRLERRRRTHLSRLERRVAEREDRSRKHEEMYLRHRVGEIPAREWKRWSRESREGLDELEDRISSQRSELEHIASVLRDVDPSLGRSREATAPGSLGSALPTPVRSRGPVVPPGKSDGRRRLERALDFLLSLPPKERGERPRGGSEHDDASPPDRHEEESPDYPDDARGAV